MRERTRRELFRLAAAAGAGSLEELDVLADPIGGRILFAGEATHHRLGYADGAMSSGIREAKRLLQRGSVALSAG